MATVPKSNRGYKEGHSVFKSDSEREKEKYRDPLTKEEKDVEKPKTKDVFEE